MITMLLCVRSMAAEDFFETIDYIGGPFDPLGKADDSDTFAEVQGDGEQEWTVHMFSMEGYYIQAIVDMEAHWWYIRSNGGGNGDGLGWWWW